MGLTKITEYRKMNRTFYILRDDQNRFWGIESKYFLNNKLMREMNGITGKMSTDMNKTIELIDMEIEVDALVATGMDFMDALMAYAKSKGVGEC